MNINWYPGHMKKTIDNLKNQINLVDMVIELCDSRIPRSSRNPYLNEILGTKPRLLVLNKMDLSDNKVTTNWLKFYEANNIRSCAINCNTGDGFNSISKFINEQVTNKNNNFKKKGILNATSRMLIVGIPNVGKSTFINKISKRKIAKTGNIPGVTKSHQWIKTNFGVELLDTPGVLWPKFENKIEGINLALIGSIKDDLLELEELSFILIKYILKNYPDLLEKFYNVNRSTSIEEIYNSIGHSKGKLSKGGIVNIEQVSKLIIDDFRKSKIGKISLEKFDDLD